MSDQTQPQTRKPLATGRIALIAALLGAVIFVCLNIVSAQIFRDARVDLTAQHLYSLSQGTRALLGELKEPVRFRLFMSSGLTKQAPQLAAFAGRVRSLLDSYAAAAKGNIILEVIDPKPFSEEEDRAVAFGIDGFTGIGGERLFFGLAATNSTTGRATIGVFAPDREAFLEYDLTRLVSGLGRRGQPAGDPDYGLQPERNVGGRPVASQNLPWMALRGDALARDEAILAQLSAVVMTTAGAFETTRDGVTLRPLVRASNAAVTLDATLAGDRTGDPRRLLVGLTKAPKPPILAARLTGTLDSAYPDGLKKEEKKPDEAKADGKKPDEAKPDAAKADESKKDEAKAADNTLKKSVKPANVILVGDADMLMDRNWIQMHTLFGQQAAQASANNGDFAVNAIEQMSGGAALSDLRGRGVSWRPFELLQRMEAYADSQFRAQVHEPTTQLKDTEQKLSQLPKAAEGSNEVLTAEQAKTIEGFRTQLLAIRSQLP